MYDKNAVSKKNRSKHCIYPNYRSALKPVPHDIETPVPIPPTAAIVEHDYSDDENSEADEVYEPEFEECESYLLNQKE